MGDRGTYCCLERAPLFSRRPTLSPIQGFGGQNEVLALPGDQGMKKLCFDKVSIAATRLGLILVLQSHAVSKAHDSRARQ